MFETITQAIAVIGIATATIIITTLSIQFASNTSRNMSLTNAKATSKVGEVQ